MKKKVAIFAHNLDFGGIEKSLTTIINTLNLSKYDITLFLEEKKGVFINNLNNISIEEYKTSNNKNIIIRKLVNRFRLLKNIILNYKKYDCSISFATYSIKNAKLALKYSSNNYLWIHNDYFDYYEKDIVKYKSFFKTINADKFKNIVFVSKQSLENFHKIMKKDNLILCNNLIDYETAFKKSNEITIEKNNKKIFLNVSRHDEFQKKISRIIESADILKKDRNDFEIWMIGSGPDHEYYKELVKKYDLNNIVKILGPKDNPYPYFKSADYFLLTSDFEGFPVVFLESLLFKLQIVSTITVKDNLINLEDYAYISNKDINDIVCKMNEALENKKEFKTFDYKKYNEEIIIKLENIINNKGDIYEKV